MFNVSSARLRVVMGHVSKVTRCLATTPAAASGSVHMIESTPADWKTFMEDGDGGAKAVYWTAAWCGPCKMISPEYVKLAEKYPDIAFAKIDVDDCQEAVPNSAQTAAISSMPTFQFFKFNSFLGQFSGADVNQLEAYLSRTNDITQEEYETAMTEAEAAQKKAEEEKKANLKEHQFSYLEMKFSIAIVSFAATVAFAVAEDCTETSEAGCNALDACTWCNCSAIPSECWTIAAASKLPSGVYACDKKMVATEERPRSHGRTARLGKHVHFAPPRSRVVEGILGGNGSSIPAGGDVWPTAIYYTTVQIGTPPQDFPVAIDSGSGDLDVSGKGCVGCVTIPPNREYDHASSKTSHPRLPFQFSNSYQTCDLKDPTAVCTITGKLYTDEVSLAGFGPVSMGLGSITKQTSNFDQFKVIDGVMGFTQGGKEDVFAQLVAAGKCTGCARIANSSRGH
eukprot:gene5835-87_t